jgi:hypothetical protein
MNASKGWYRLRVISSILSSATTVSTLEYIRDRRFVLAVKAVSK